jgi:hypothetical protein
MVALLDDHSARIVGPAACPAGVGRALASPSLSVAERHGLTGQVLEPGEDGDDEARSLWNGDLDRRPSVIARGLTAADVSAAVGWAPGQPRGDRGTRRRALTIVEGSRPSTSARNSAPFMKCSVTFSGSSPWA